VNAMLAPTRATIDEHALRAFGAALRGQLISPVDPDYSQARKVWNGMIDRRPALIVRCAGAGDVLAAVGFARTTGLPVAVRGGGHSAAGNGVCEGGLVVDLSRMKGLRVDPIARAARAEPGLTWSEFDAETQAFGLATTGGGVSTTGVAGLTLGGGLGWLMRKHGLTCDNLLAADVVTADGRLLHVSRTEHPDLFWGLRGGGGNFGVVTSFEYRLHPVDVVLAGTVTFPFAEAADVVRFFREFTADAPDELTCYLNLAGDPELGAVVAIDVCYAGPTEEGEAALRPLRQLRSPLSDNIAPRRYRDFNATDPATVFPHGARNYWKSSFMRDLSDDAIETLIRRLQVAPSLDTCCGWPPTRRPSPTATSSTISSSSRPGLPPRRTTGISPGCGKRGRPCGRLRATRSTSTIWARRRWAGSDRPTARRRTPGWRRSSGPTIRTTCFASITTSRWRSAMTRSRSPDRDDIGADARQTHLA
jgi:FAD binding domain